jgi:hypothetical protein
VRGPAGARARIPRTLRAQSRLRRLYGAATATRRARLVTAAAALAVTGGVVVVVVSQTGGGGARPRPVTKVAPKRVNKVVLLSESGLEALANRVGHPTYWVGPQPRVTYELTSAPDGRIFLRYLPAGSKAGAEGAYLSVGTYPFAGAFAATVRAGGQKGFARVKVAAGVAAVYTRGRPTNVFVAFRGADYQIELFDAKPGRARRLVAERRIVPVP